MRLLSGIAEAGGISFLSLQGDFPMKLFHRLSLSVLAVLAITFSSAQALPPISKVVKVNPKIKQPAADESLKHGMKVTLNLTDKTSVSGTVVYADNSADYLLLRTTPGALPKKILGKNIADITRIRLTSDSGSTKADEPEIHEVTIINGTRKSVRYFAPALSAQERAKLTELENTDNEIARIEDVLRLTNQALKDEVRAAREQTIAMERQNALLRTQLYWLSAGPYYGGYYPTPYGGYYPTFGPYTPVGSSGPAVSTRLLETALTKETTLTSQLAKLRQSQSQLQSAGLYEDGRLVAVAVEPQK
jgi:hypothetical protein